MTIWKFENWCDAAVDGIIFPPDRKMVRQELLNHIYDHYDDLIEQGLDRETAQTLALTAMGDAKEIAPQLAAIHRPFWGYLLRLTRFALIATLCAAILLTVCQLWRTRYHDFSEYNNLDPFTDTVNELEDSTYTRVFYAEPNQSVQSDGYTITLTQAAIWYADHHDNDLMGEDNHNFYFRMDVFNPRPWAADSDIPRWFWAVDSLGNTYDCFHEGIVNFAPYIVGNGYHTAPLTYTHDMWISDFRSEEAEWIDFHYDRDGRNLVLRLDLTGGDAA